MVAAICDMAPHLQYVDLSCCSRLTDAGVYHLHKLTQLHSLRLEALHQVTGESGFAKFRAPHLKRLYLSHCENLSDACLEPLAACSTELWDVHFGKCSKLSARAMRTFLARNKRIRKLQLSVPIWVCVFLPFDTRSLSAHFVVLFPVYEPGRVVSDASAPASAHLTRAR